MNDFLPGFDVEDEKGQHTVPTLGGVDNFPISNRKTSTPDFKSEMARGTVSIRTLDSNEGGRGIYIVDTPAAEGFHPEDETPTGGKVPVSNRTPTSPRRCGNAILTINGENSQGGKDMSCSVSNRTTHTLGSNEPAPILRTDAENSREQGGSETPYHHRWDAFAFRVRR